MQTKLEQLRQWFRSKDRVAVAYSGGVDSTVVLKVAHDELGHRTTAFLAVSESLPGSEKDSAIALAHSMGANLRILATTETSDPRYQVNAPNRCYYCKQNVYSTIRSVAGDDLIVDGMNADDTQDVRPGRAAARELGIMSPLCELGFRKEDVRAAARELRLSNWDKPAAACLASRVPYGSPVTIPILAQIEKAELMLKEIGFSDLRVRHHGDVARLEVPDSELAHAIQERARIQDAMKAVGFVYVTLDLEGLRSGSSNEVLKSRS